MTADTRHESCLLSMLIDSKTWLQTQGNECYMRLTDCVQRGVADMSDTCVCMIDVCVWRYISKIHVRVLGFESSVARWHVALECRARVSRVGSCIRSLLLLLYWCSWGLYIYIATTRGLLVLLDLPTWVMSPMTIGTTRRTTSDTLARLDLLLVIHMMHN